MAQPPLRSPKSLSRRRAAFALAALAVLGPASVASSEPYGFWRRRAWRRWRAEERYRRWLEAQPRYQEDFREDFPDSYPEVDERAAEAFDHRVQEAERRGEIRPLREVEALVQAFDAELLDVELIESRTGWVYALRVITPHGRRRDIFLDAATLRRLHR